MTRVTYPQKSINGVNGALPDPFVVENLTVNNESNLNILNVSGNSALQVIQATTVNANTLIADSLLLDQNATIGGNINSSTGNITLLTGNITLTSGDITASAGSATFGTVVNFSESSSGVRALTQTAGAIAATDKILLLSTTGAGGPFVITPTDLGPNIYKITIIMALFNTAVFTFVCQQGTVTFAGPGDCASFIWTGNEWSLMGEPHGAIVS